MIALFAKAVRRLMRDDPSTAHDDMDDYVARREQREPGFARMVEEETQRLLREHGAADDGDDGGGDNPA